MVNYEQLIIYYFSGTGNARNAARWISDIAEKKGIETHLISIDRFETIDQPDLSKKTLVGFCSPTHGFNLPPIMLKFIRKFPRVDKTDAFILNTRGGLKLSRFFIPGISGAAQFLPALMLRSKGFRIVGMQPLDLPSNWLILHPALKDKVIRSIYSRCNKIVNDFGNRLLDGKTKYKALLSLPIDILILPVAFGYYFIGRFFLAKTLVATHACNNCNKCIDQCPVEAIVMTNNRPFWKYNCESCMRCVNACPQRAIETTHTYSGLVMLISVFILSPLLIIGLNYLGIKDLFDQSILTRNIWSIIDTVVFLIFVFLSYKLLHFFMRYRIFNFLISYSSLSKYSFWRRYKAPGL